MAFINGDYRRFSNGLSRYKQIDLFYNTFLDTEVDAKVFVVQV